MREMRNAYTILARKPERKSPFGRPRHGWDYNIRKGHLNQLYIT
jgi:hypothetical protein